MSEADDDLRAVITKHQLIVAGLRLEVEGWRRHASSTGEFILDEIDAMLKSLNTALAKLK